QPLALIVTANNAVEPVAGGTVTFSAPSSGASAALGSSGPVPIGSNGQASTTATANASAGPYTVTASTRGASSTAQFLLANLRTAAFSSLAGPTITYGTATVTLSGMLLAGSVVPTGSVTVTLEGVTHSAAIQSQGRFSTSFDTESLGVDG